MEIKKRGPNPETPIQREVLSMLNFYAGQGVIAYRYSNHAVPIFERRGKASVLKNWRKDKWKMLGHSDIVILAKGRVVFCEAKVPGAELSDEQKAFREILQERGLDYVVAHSGEEAVNALIKMGVIR